MTLDEAIPGFEGTILEIEGNPLVVERLREVGCVRGEKIRVVSRLVFGEPLIVEVRGSTLALRKSEARCVRL